MRTTLKIVFPLIVSVATVSLLLPRIRSKRKSASSTTISPTGQRFSVRTCRKASSPCSIAYRTKACNGSSNDSSSANT